MEPEKKSVYIVGNDINDNKHLHVLKKFGFSVIVEDSKCEFLDFFMKKEINENIFKNVILADMVILSQFYHEPCNDSMLAIGAALALGKDVWVIGSKKSSGTTLYYNKNVVNFNSWFEVYSELHPLV